MRTGAKLEKGGRQRMAQTQGFMTALYERLSRDDELNGESQSENASGAVCKGTWLYKSDSFYG